MMSNQDNSQFSSLRWFYRQPQEKILRNRFFFLIVQLTSSEVDRGPAEPLYGPGVVVYDVLLALRVTPTITRYGRKLAATTTRGIHRSNHRQSAASLTRNV